VLKRVFAIIARSKIEEIFTAAALLARRRHLAADDHGWIVHVARRISGRRAAGRL